MIDYQKILHDLKQLPQTRHDSGPLDDSALNGVADHCREYGTIFSGTAAPFFDTLVQGRRHQPRNKGFLRRTRRLQVIKPMVPVSPFNLIAASLRLKVRTYR